MLISTASPFSCPFSSSLIILLSSGATSLLLSYAKLNISKSPTLCESGPGISNGSSFVKTLRIKVNNSFPFISSSVSNNLNLLILVNDSQIHGLAANVDTGRNPSL